MNEEYKFLRLYVRLVEYQLAFSKNFNIQQPSAGPLILHHLTKTNTSDFLTHCKPTEKDLAVIYLLQHVRIVYQYRKLSAHLAFSSKQVIPLSLISLTTKTNILQDPYRNITVLDFPPKQSLHH